MRRDENGILARPGGCLRWSGENPDSGRKTRLTWTVLPQGFRSSPTLFGNELAKDLEQWEQCVQWKCLGTTRREFLCQTRPLDHRWLWSSARSQECQHGFACGNTMMDWG